MKKIAAFLGLALLLAGCSSNFTQEMKEGASFANLEKFYVDPASGLTGSYAFIADTTYAATESAVAEFLESRGYKKVANRAEAQIIFRPLWNVSEVEEPFDTNAVAARAEKYYATLEVQAVLPDSGDIWSWRGFSPVNMRTDNASDSLIKTQVKWCLQYFPPEKYPSALEVSRQKRAERRAQKAAEESFLNVPTPETSKQ